MTDVKPNVKAEVSSISQREQARGSLLGALIGDSVGSLLEFIGYQPSAQEVDQALSMPGGGVWRIAPGQVTDDGELTLALGQALAGAKRLPQAEIARNYVRWYRSKPFDIGNTTASALDRLMPSESGLHGKLLAQAAENNQASKANGSLMRQSVLGIWSSHLSVEQAVVAAQTDSRFTHPNPTCQWAGAAYVVAIRNLVLSPGKSEEAFEAARSQLLEHNGDKDRGGRLGDGVQEVLGWMQDARDGKLPAGYPQVGFVRIAFTHAFHHLLQRTPYRDALHDTLSLGGDTDTNACIVGGLLGALHGYSGLPAAMVKALLNCDTNKGRPRPLWLQANVALELADALVKGTNSEDYSNGDAL